MSALTPNSFNPISKDTKPSSKNKKTIIIASVGVFLVAGIAGSAMWYSNSQQVTQANSEVTFSQSTQSQASPSNEDEATTSSQSESSLNISNAIDESILEEGREEVSQYISNKPNIQVEDVATSEVFAVEQVKSVKQEIEKTRGAQGAPSVPADTNRKMAIQIQYSNVGDEQFSQGSLYIRLSDGLKIVPGSIKDIVGGTTLDVNDNVYDGSKNLIQYAPSSRDQKTGLIAVGQKGVIGFTVEFSKPDIEIYGITSYLQDNGGQTGVPGFIFLENK
jgi:flagellar basal body-associated protein FliL